ncbi:CotS family spore coat protein [[Clostridium] polysaccharolyticum]|uniref:Spore coat protein, CotS family n=1 Tax=[Clostridium] polysaccharolyticum TaxID=29364 RepID=A0A1I0FYX4_9FIRM|nr:CotS family spore coat protein [[Clostridium] polysaccharolyticum]SET63492.1 spore coat protein, CotS family [[Clostridium] polysaccharolyticum]
MDDRYEEIFRQYNFKIENIYRARGALLLETDKGVKLFRSIQSSKQRIEFEHELLVFLTEQGNMNVDQYCLNKENEIISEDSQGEKYIIKNWCIGEESNLKELVQVKNAARNLASLHEHLKSVPFAKDRPFAQTKMLPVLFEKHNRELKRVRTYIIDKKQKNEFEVRFLSVYERFYKQAMEATDLLAGSSFEELMKSSVNSGTVTHGSYTYHNIIVTSEGIFTTNFDKADIGIQIFDLYYFLRKVMEKNNWDIMLSNVILKEYFSNHEVSQEEQELLYILMLYPEKFWKVTNYYFNGKKSWISGRTIQKLSCIQQQEEMKNLFLQNLRRYCII